MRAQAIRRKIPKKASLAGRELPKSISPGGSTSEKTMPNKRKIHVAQLKAFRIEFPLSDSNHDGCVLGTDEKPGVASSLHRLASMKNLKWASHRQYPTFRLLNGNRRSFAHHPRTELRSGPRSLRMTAHCWGRGFRGRNCLMVIRAERCRASSSVATNDIGMVIGPRGGRCIHEGSLASENKSIGLKSYPAWTSFWRLMERPSRRRRLRKTTVETTVRTPRAMKAL